MKIYVGSIGEPLTKKKQSGSISGHGEGIYTLSWDGKQLHKQFTTYANQASVIYISRNKNYLYAVNEVRNFTGLNGSGGGISAYAIQKDHTLHFLNASISYGSRPAFISESENGKYLLVANHGSHSSVTCHYVQNDKQEWILQRDFDDSSIAVFEKHDDGTIGNLIDLMQFKGHGYWCHGGGQSTSHLHSIKVRGNLIFACNRGTDEIEVLRLNEQTGKLTLLQKNHTQIAYAPRYFTFHPKENILYVLFENYPALAIYKYKEDGTLIHLQTCKTMPEDYYNAFPLPHYTKQEADINETNTCSMANPNRAMPSDIHISTNGHFLYVSNRRFASFGTIMTYKILDASHIQPLSTLCLNGKDPRGFMISQDNQYMFVGLLDKDIIEVYKLMDGIPSAKIDELTISSPSCFLEYIHF